MSLEGRHEPLLTHDPGEKENGSAEERDPKGVESHQSRNLGTDGIGGNEEQEQERDEERRVNIGGEGLESHGRCVFLLVFREFGNSFGF